MIDIATLTGAKGVVLGAHTNALFCDDDALRETLLAAGQKTGEPLWRMPLDPAYDRQIKSRVADLKNSGGRSGGVHYRCPLFGLLCRRVALGAY